MVLPKLSIITPSYNQGKYIRKTIESVLKQNYTNFEHIVIDGGSTDETLDILKSYEHLKWISEKDEGQSNAINKGFKIATGDIIAWLNSDDFYERNIFQFIANYFSENEDCKFLYGNITYVDESENFIKINAGENLSFDNLISNPDIIRQPSTFWSMKLLKEAGFLDENLYLVMDLDLFLRFSKITNFHYVDMSFSYYRTYPQTKTLSNLRKQAKEICKVVKKHAGYLPTGLKKRLILKYFKSVRSFNSTLAFFRKFKNLTLSS